VVGMPRHSQPFRSRPRDRTQLQGMLHRGVQQVRVVNRADSPDPGTEQRVSPGRRDDPAHESRKADAAEQQQEQPSHAESLSQGGWL
jgi:hypothetical protein